MSRWGCGDGYLPRMLTPLEYVRAGRTHTITAIRIFSGWPWFYLSIILCVDGINQVTFLCQTEVPAPSPHLSNYGKSLSFQYDSRLFVFSWFHWILLNEHLSHNVNYPRTTIQKFPHVYTFSCAGMNVGLQWKSSYQPILFRHHEVGLKRYNHKSARLGLLISDTTEEVRMMKKCAYWHHPGMGRIESSGVWNPCHHWIFSHNHLDSTVKNLQLYVWTLYLNPYPS